MSRPITVQDGRTRSIYVGDAVWAALRAIAAERGTGVAEVVRLALAEYVARNQPEKRTKKR